MLQPQPQPQDMSKIIMEKCQPQPWAQALDMSKTIMEKCQCQPQPQPWPQAQDMAKTIMEKCYAVSTLQVIVLVHFMTIVCIPMFYEFIWNPRKMKKWPISLGFRLLWAIFFR